MELNLQYFDSTYTVTCLNGGNFTAFSASPNSSVAKGATVTLTVTPASGYELDEVYYDIPDSLRDTYSTMWMKVKLHE